MLVREKVNIHTCFYPHFERFNPILHKIIMQRASIRNMGATMTEWRCNIVQFREIAQYALKVITQEDTCLESAYKCNYPLQLRQLWGQWYAKGDYQLSHTHLPNHWSFVYYVNTPKGASPLIFPTSCKRVKAEAGKFVIFPAFLQHYVPKNNGEGRSVIGGNLLYNTEDYNDAF